MTRKKKNRLKATTLRRTIYQLKRQSTKWKRRRRTHYQEKLIHERKELEQYSKGYNDLAAPENYSFVHNTNEVLKYFNDAGTMFSNSENVNFDISKIKKLTPDAIALHVSTIKRSSLVRRCFIKGNYPEEPELNKLFTQSGFQRFVKTTGQKAKTSGNFLHQETHYKVEPLIAKNAALVGIRHTYGNEKPYEPLYDILIECMSNTNNHATLNEKDKTHWWLYVYNDPKSLITSYSFLDLGVGIFESIEVQDFYQHFIKRILVGKFYPRHIDLVDDLLAGRIQSRVDKDNEIRGKGIPQIVEHSQRRTFKEFYLISNDVKVNLKTSEKEQLKYNFGGTFFYWEIQNTL